MKIAILGIFACLLALFYIFWLGAGWYYAIVEISVVIGISAVFLYLNR